MIQARGITHTYDGHTVLRLDQLSVAAGDACLILGGSGSGKTTLLHILAGILKPSAGEVQIGGTALGSLNGGALDRFRGQKIGIVLQRFHLIAAITVLQNLLLAQVLAGKPRDAAAAEQVLADLGVAQRKHAYPRELSHGQAQRVAIARAIVNRPLVLLADEPTSNLDDANCEEAFKLIRGEAEKRNAALIIATHDARIKNAVANRVELSGVRR
jgi:putative ABC transport system ATP-binding protein